MVNNILECERHTQEIETVDFPNWNMMFRTRNSDDEVCYFGGVNGERVG